MVFGLLPLMFSSLMVELNRSQTLDQTFIEVVRNLYIYVLENYQCNLFLQSSWTKQAVEVDSPCPVSPWDAECPDSTCAQVIHSNAEASGNKWVPVTAARGCQEWDEQLGKHEFLDV